MVDHPPSAFVLRISWDRPGLPSLVGPFETADEARHWGNLNIPNGTWSILNLAYPYAQLVGERQP